MRKLLFLFLFSNLVVTAQTKRVVKTMNDSIFEVGDIIKIPEIPFFTCVRERELYDYTKDSMNIVAIFLLKQANLIVEISSHTDLRGSIAFNQKLSGEKAKLLADYLIQEKNISPNRVIPKGYGESQPLISEAEINKAKTKEEYESLMSINRRIELVVLKVE